MDDRIERLTARARTPLSWHAPSEDLVRRVTETVVSRGAAPNPAGQSCVEVPPPGPASGVRSLGFDGAFQRSTPIWRSSGAEIYRSFPGGEIACHAEEGDALGAWVLRGTVWLAAAEASSAVLDWVEEDHVLATVPVRSGEAFEVEEFAGPSWHLELRVAEGRAHRLDPRVS